MPSKHNWIILVKALICRRRSQERWEKLTILRMPEGYKIPDRVKLVTFPSGGSSWISIKTVRIFLCLFLHLKLSAGIWECRPFRPLLPLKFTWQRIQKLPAQILLSWLLNAGSNFRKIQCRQSDIPRLRQLFTSLGARARGLGYYHSICDATLPQGEDSGDRTLCSGERSNEYFWHLRDCKKWSVSLDAPEGFAIDLIAGACWAVQRWTALILWKYSRLISISPHL